MWAGGCVWVGGCVGVGVCGALVSSLSRERRHQRPAVHGATVLVRLLGGEEPLGVDGHQVRHVTRVVLPAEDRRHRVAAPVVIRVVLPELRLQLARREERFLHLGLLTRVAVLLAERFALVAVLVPDLNKPIRVGASASEVFGFLRRFEVFHAHVVGGGLDGLDGHFWLGWLGATSFLLRFADYSLTGRRLQFLF